MLAGEPAGPRDTPMRCIRREAGRFGVAALMSRVGVGRIGAEGLDQSMGGWALPFERDQGAGLDPRPIGRLHEGPAAATAAMQSIRTGNRLAILTPSNWSSLCAPMVRVCRNAS